MIQGKKLILNDYHCVNIKKYYDQPNSLSRRLILWTAVKRLLSEVSRSRSGRMMGYTARVSRLSSIFGIRRLSTFEQSWVMAGLVLTSISQSLYSWSIMKSIPKS